MVRRNQFASSVSSGVSNRDDVFGDTAAAEYSVPTDITEINVRSPLYSVILTLVCTAVSGAALADVSPDEWQFQLTPYECDAWADAQLRLGRPDAGLSSS